MCVFLETLPALDYIKTEKMSRRSKETWQTLSLSSIDFLNTDPVDLLCPKWLLLPKYSILPLTSLILPILYGYFWPFLTSEIKFDSCRNQRGIELVQDRLQSEILFWFYLSGHMAFTSIPPVSRSVLDAWTDTGRLVQMDRCQLFWLPEHECRRAMLRRTSRLLRKLSRFNAWSAIFQP